MNIGILSQALPYLPSRDGFRLYGANLIRHLSQRHTIDLISLLEETDEDHLDWPRRYCRRVYAVSKATESVPKRFANVASAHIWGRPLASRKEIASALHAGIAAGRWDVLHVEGAYAGGLVPPDLRIPKVLSLHDSETLRCREIFKCSPNLREKFYYTFRKYYEPRYERLVYARFDCCTAVAERDLHELRSVVPGTNFTLIPNGIDSEYYHPLPAQKEVGTLVFHGHLGYPPNIEAASEFANGILPLVQQEVPTALFHIVGASPGAKVRDLVSRPGVRISPDLPDLRSAVCSGQVYVSAIRHGSGLKNKILEAMAMGVPVVCYPGSAVGIEAIPGRHLVVAESIEQFAASVVCLLRNPDCGEKIAQAARQLVEEKYSWESRARAYELLYTSIVEGYAPQPQRHVPYGVGSRSSSAG